MYHIIIVYHKSLLCIDTGVCIYIYTYIQCSLSYNMFYDNSCYLSKKQHFTMWHGYVLFRMMIESRTFIHMFAIWSTVVLSFSCYTFFFWMFMIVLLIGILRECSVFILQIVPTCFASSWERLLGHVCHTTDKQANPVPNIYIYMLIHVYWIHLNDLNVDLWNLKIYLYECMHTQIRYINVHICTHTHLHKCT